LFTIRTSGAADQDHLFAIWDAAVRTTHQFLSPEHRQMIAQMVRDQYLPNTVFTVAAEASGLPLAFMGTTGDMIDALFVDPNFHGQGIGRALIEHAQLGRADLRVDVNEDNREGLAFYRHLGFQIVGRSETDSSGLPYPLLHLARPDPRPKAEA
jgi:putative acetyltransferase